MGSCLQGEDEEAGKKKPLLAGGTTSKDDVPHAKYTEIEEKKQGNLLTPVHIAPDTEQKTEINLVIPGKCLIEQTFDLQKDLESLRQKYPQQYKPLLERKMVATKPKTQTQNVRSGASITVMQFNMLADGLSTSYLNAVTDKTFINVDKACLQWTYRGLRLVEEMTRYSADIICVEECDHLPFLMEYMSRHGYKSFFQQKTKSPMNRILNDILKERGLSANDASIQMPNDGIALMYKTDTFELTGDEGAVVQYIDMKKNKEAVMGLAVPLRIKSINKEVLFVVTHLKSTKTEEGEQLRERQINLLMNELVQNERKLPVILCCDLNANPVQNKKGYDPLCYNSIVNADNLAFQSVYKLANGSEPEYTTFKARKHGVDKHVLDYIFMRGGEWNVTQILEIPRVSEDNLDEVIPNWHYPSDHFSIAAQLTWIENEEEKKEADAAVLPLPGQCLMEATFDLDKDLEILKKRYDGKYSALLERKMADIACDAIDDTYDIGANSVRIMQFNMLADGLCTAYNAVESEKTFMNVDKECLQWSYRGIRVVEEIARYDADVIAIEECDQLAVMMKYLKPKGYDSCFQIKDTSAISKVAKSLSEERNADIDMALDGVALIYKSDKLQICGEVQQIASDNKEKVFGLAVPLRIKSINKEVLFVVTHLKSTKTEEGEQLRERQINLLMKELIQNEANLPIILCCDLNANPVQNKKGYDPLCYNSIVNADNLAFQSVYKLANGSEPEYTTFKARKHGIDKHVLDYIFIRGGEWNVTQILEIPRVSEENLDELIPNWCYPSDHFSIAAQLTWK